MAPTFGDEEKALLSIVSAVSASLSLAGAVLLICILLTRFLHRRAQMERQSDRSSSIILGWLLVIAVCDALYAFFGILLIDLLGAAGVEREHGWLCALQGVGMDMFPTACNYATFWLSLHTWRTWLHVVSPIASSEHSCIRWLLDLRLQGVIMLSVSIFSGIVPLFDTSFARYEYSDTWCWIGGRYKAARQALFYGHIIAIFIVILGLYAHVLLVHARNTLRFEEPSLQGEDPSGARLAKARRVMGMARHFLRYPVGFLIIWAPGIFNRLYETSHEPLYATTLLQAITAPSQGTINFLIYATSPEFVLQLRTLGLAAVRGVCCCSCVRGALAQKDGIEGSDDASWCSLQMPSSLPSSLMSSLMSSRIAASERSV